MKYKYIKMTNKNNDIIVNKIKQNKKLHVWTLHAFKPLEKEGSSKMLWISQESFAKDEGRITTK